MDTSFGIGGKVTTPTENNYALAIQTDGKIVVAGDTFNGSSSDIAVVRYNSNGSLDTSFGSGGKAGVGLSGLARNIAIQTDGKIVVAGAFAVVRYNSNGSLDTSFGSGGKVNTTNVLAIDIGIQNDGKIVVAGCTIISGFSDIVVLRYNSNGSLDTSFGIGGKVTTTIGSKENIANALGIQTDGKIVVAGIISNGSDQDIAVLRYNSNGSLDSSFGNSGVVWTAIGSKNDVANALAIQTDGKIVVAGYTAKTSGSDIAVVRYNSNGSADTSFGNGGIVTTTIGNNQVANALAIQTDGKIVVAGNDGGDNIALVRYNNSLIDSINDGSDGGGGCFINSIHH